MTRSALRSVSQRCFPRFLALKRRCNGVIHALQPDELQAFARVIRDIVVVALIPGWKHNTFQSGPRGRSHLFLNAADRQDETAQTDLAGHGGVVAQRCARSGAKNSAVKIATPALGPSFCVAPGRNVKMDVAFSQR